MKTSGGKKVAVRLSSPLLKAGILSVLRDIPHLTVIETDGSVSSITSIAPDAVIADIFDQGFISTVRESSNAVLLPVVTSVLPHDITDGFTVMIGLYDSVESIADKIRSVLHSNGKTEPDRPGDDLSPREKDVILGIVKGLSNKEIAGEINVSVNTVMTHRRNIASKLQIHSAAGLTIYAITTGLVDIEDIKNSAFI